MALHQVLLRHLFFFPSLSSFPIFSLLLSLVLVIDFPYLLIQWSHCNQKPEVMGNHSSSEFSSSFSSFSLLPSLCILFSVCVWWCLSISGSLFHPICASVCFLCTNPCYTFQCSYYFSVSWKKIKIIFHYLPLFIFFLLF